VLCDVAPCNVLHLLVTANALPSSMIRFTLTMEATCTSEASVLIRDTLHHNPEDDILRSHHREYLKSYIALAGWALSYELDFYIP
jgi:hypothetical protein